jgi:hypothetical protein
MTITNNTKVKTNNNNTKIENYSNNNKHNNKKNNFHHSGAQKVDKYTTTPSQQEIINKRLNYFNNL